MYVKYYFQKIINSVERIKINKDEKIFLKKKKILTKLKVRIKF